MKCIEMLAIAHIHSIIPDTLDPLISNRRRNINCTKHCPLPPIKEGYLCELVIDYSLVFSSIVPSKVVNRLETLGLNNSLCNWILNFLTSRPQVVRVGDNTSAILTLSTGAPLGCVLSPLLYSLFTHDCGHARLQVHHQVC